MAEPFNILIADKVALDGLEAYTQSAAFNFDERHKITPQELLRDVANYDAVIVRSRTQMTAEVIAAGGSRLKVIGRAGVGVDNIDIDAATHHGVLVMNTPEGNITSAAEHALALMMTMARNIPQADSSMHEGKWEKAAFTGVELHGKTLGVIGTGKVGRIVSRVALALGMRVLAYDPYIPQALAEKFGIELGKDLDDVLSQSDLLTIHTPLNEKTRGLIDRNAIAKMPWGVRIINAARGGILDEAALVEALESGHVAGAALDVFSEEPLGDSPLRKFSNVILTPHLGASTVDAQTRVAVDIVAQVAAYLKDKRVLNAVNMASLSSDAFVQVEPFLGITEVIGAMHRQLLSGQPESIDVNLYGLPAEHDAIVTQAFFVGLLQGTCATTVNLINASTFARERHLRWSVSKREQGTNYRNLVEVTVKAGDEELCIAGSISEAGTRRIVRVGNYRMEAEPQQCMLVMWNTDVPGIIGTVGTILGNAGINIGEWRLGRFEKTAFSLISVDSEVDESLRKAIASNRAITRVELLKLPVN